MKKKNLVLLGSAALLSLALAGTIGTVAVASADTKVDNGNGEATTTVTYTVANSWEVTIPETITVGGDEAEVKAENVHIEKDTTLHVNVTSSNGWAVQNETGDKSIEYDLKIVDGDDTALTDGKSVLDVEAGTTEGGSAKLKATLKNPDDAKYSTGGDAYEDELTFEVSVD